MLLHVFEDGPPCSVVMLLLPEFNEVENVHDYGFYEIFNFVEQDDVESKVLEELNYNRRLFPSSEGLIHS